MISSPLERGDGVGATGTATAGAWADTVPRTTFGFRARLTDYLMLGKVRISVMVLLVTAVGFCLGSSGPVDIMLLFHTLLGTGLVAFAANALNQFMERDCDGRMTRTMDRPLPAGRMSPMEAVGVGILTACLGLIQLVWFVNLLAALISAATILTYLLIYTPLKRRTVYNTWIGAVPGALPPLIGYAASRGEIDSQAAMLFAILFVWQLPHFFAIAWMYREDYAAGGYRMLSVGDENGRQTRWQTLVLTVLLAAVSLWPALTGHSGPVALVVCVLLGASLIGVAARMARSLTHANARLMLLASVLYLPAVMLLLLVDRAAR